ncbi:MAG: hypothetical protein E7314_00025 [Clostridiales bacterium]|nr:hypothetical protein [Clostridiales bacterium]
MESKLKWQNTELKPEESFKKADYETLIQYAKENEHTLICEFFNGNASDFGLTLKYGSAKMNYFQKVIEEYPLFYALFKLGELNGHLDVFNAIKYEEQLDKIASHHFSDFVLNYSSSAELAKAILKRLYNTGEILLTLTDLEKALNTDKKHIKGVLRLLARHNFINCCESSYEKFSLTDLGKRVGKQLN